MTTEKRREWSDEQLEAVIAPWRAEVDETGENYCVAWARKVLDARADLAELRQAHDEMAYRFSCFLDYTTGGRMSKTNYDMAVMRQGVDEEQDREFTQWLADEIEAGTVAPRAKLEGAIKALEWAADDSLSGPMAHCDIVDGKPILLARITELRAELEKLNHGNR